ncbi:MAG: hypothetical protein AVDCRST_MAG57-3148, partial [uncultured Blastococcus sp.]
DRRTVRRLRRSAAAAAPDPHRRGRPARGGRRGAAGTGHITAARGPRPALGCGFARRPRGGRAPAAGASQRACRRHDPGRGGPDGRRDGRCAVLLGGAPSGDRRDRARRGHRRPRLAGARPELGRLAGRRPAGAPGAAVDSLARSGRRRGAPHPIGRHRPFARRRPRPAGRGAGGAVVAPDGAGARDGGPRGTGTDAGADHRGRTGDAGHARGRHTAAARGLRGTGDRRAPGGGDDRGQHHAALAPPRRPALGL